MSSDYPAPHRERSALVLVDVQRVDTVVVPECKLPNCPRATLFDASEPRSRGRQTQ